MVRAAPFLACAFCLLGLAACEPPQWLRANPGSTVALDAVHGTSPTDVWAVGDLGTISHFDGARWTVAAPLTSVHLRAVAAASPTDVWVVGDSGVALRFNGTAWARVDLGVTKDFLAAVALAPNDVWLLPKDSHEVLHWDGVRVTAVDATTRSGYGRCLWGNSPANLWLLPSYSSHAYRLTTAGVFEVPLDISGDFDCLDISGQAPDDVWLLEEDRLLHYDGRLFRPTAPAKDLLSSFYARAVFAAARNTAWVVGTGGGIFLVQGETWTQSAAFTYGGPALSSVWGARTDDLWVTGDKGTLWRHATPEVAE